LQISGGAGHRERGSHGHFGWRVVCGEWLPTAMIARRFVGLRRRPIGQLKLVLEKVIKPRAEFFNPGSRKRPVNIG
jgi:hypothetical protein